MDARAESRPPRDPRAGLVLSDRYRLLRKIGEGGMGDVYEAEHISIAKPVAVKLLHPTFATRPEVLRRFHREALAASQLAHPHIVEVSDLGRAPDGCPFMVLELLRGHDLAIEIDRAPRMPLGRVVRIARQVCAALAAAHDNGIVHRDLKPENIFLCSDRHAVDYVKLVDFGISKFQGDLSGPFPMTVTGTALGTPYFMSPEQVEARRDVDGRADIWALGVVMYLALTGMFPYDADNYPLLFVRICTQDAVPIDAIRTDLPRDFANLIGKMLARDPNDRFRNCHDVHSALARFEKIAEAPQIRPPARADSSDSIQPGALAIARAGALIDPRGRTPSAPIPEVHVSEEEAKRMLDAGLDLPAGRPVPKPLADAIETDVRPARRLDPARGTRAARDLSARAASGIAPARPRPLATHSNPRPVDPELTLPRSVSRASAVVVFALAAGLGARGFRNGVSIVYGHATTSGLIRDGFAIYTLAVAVAFATMRADEPLARVGRLLATLVPIVIAATFAIDFVGGLVVR